MGECVSVMGQKKSAVHRRVGVLELVFLQNMKHIKRLPPNILTNILDMDKDNVLL